MIREVSWMILGSIATTAAVLALLSNAAATRGDVKGSRTHSFMAAASLTLLGFMVFLYVNE